MNGKNPSDCIYNIFIFWLKQDHYVMINNTHWTAQKTAHQHLITRNLNHKLKCDESSTFQTAT